VPNCTALVVRQAQNRLTGGKVFSAGKATLTGSIECSKENMTNKIHLEAIKWPEDVAPSHCPIHFTNELEVAASPETIWSLLVDPEDWPSFYPGVEHVQLFDGHQSLRLGTRLETNLAAQDVLASVEEFEPITRIAWYGGRRTPRAQGLPRLDHHTQAQRMLPMERRDDARSALDRTGQKGSRCFLAHTREAISDPCQSGDQTRELSPSRNVCSVSA
jgi:hypothetical protein